MKNIICLAIGMLSFALRLQAAINVVDYWHLGENDPGAAANAAMTNSADIVGGHTLTNSGALTYSTNVSASASVATGSYLDIRFTNNACATSAVIPGLTTNFGVELWVNPATASGAQSIFYNGNSGGSGWGLYVTGNTFSGLFGGVSFIFGSVTFTPGTWNHVALVESDSGATLYVNGAVSATLSTSPNSPSGLLTVGANVVGTENFSGLIDEIRVFTFASGQFSTNDLSLNKSYFPGKTRFIESSNAASDTLALTVNPSNATWTATANAPWLHVPASGTGSTNLSFTFDGNPGTGSRIGTMTVAGQTVSIIQLDNPLQVVSYWRMGENDLGAANGNPVANPTDLAGNHNLAFHGPAYYSSDVAQTASFNVSSSLSLNFSSANGYANCDNFTTVADNFGVELWVYPATTNGGVLVYNGNTGHDGWGLFQSGTNFAGLFGGVSFLGSIPAPINTWSHLALVRNGQTTTIYLDGAPVYSEFYYDPYIPPGNFQIGANNYGGQNFTGLIDEVRVFTFPPGQFDPHYLLWNSANYQLSHQQFSEPAAAGSDSFGLTTLSSSFPWSASANVPWLHLAETNGSGSATIGFSFDANSATNAVPRNGTMTIASQTVMVTQAAPFSLATNLLLEPLTAGADAVVLTEAPIGANWTATADVPWLHLAETNGTASATIGFTYDANTNPNVGPRSGTLTIAGQTVTVNQASATYLLATNALYEPLTAGSDAVNLTVTPSFGTWTATAHATWLHLAVTNGTGSATIGFNFDTNNAPNAGPRTGTLTIAGQTLSVNQAAVTFSPSTNILTESLSAGSDTVNLTVTPEIGSWTATAEVPWIHFTATNGAGSATILFTFDTDVGFSPRVGNIKVGGQQVAILQGPQVVVTNLVEGSGAGVETVPVFFLNYFGTPLSTTANTNWLHISSKGAHASSGNTNVAFTFDANTNAAPRTGTLTIQGTTVTVTQAGASYQAAGVMTFLDLTPYADNAYNYGPVPQGLAVDADGNLYIVMTMLQGYGYYDMPPYGGDSENGYILKWSTNNSLSVLVAKFGTDTQFPMQVALDAGGNVYFNDRSQLEIFRWDAGTSNVTAVGAANPFTLTVDSAGDVYFATVDAPDYPQICLIHKWQRLDNTIVSLGAPSIGVSFPPGLDDMALDPFGFLYESAGFISPGGTYTSYQPFEVTTEASLAMAFDDSVNFYFSGTDGLFKLSEADYAAVPLAPGLDETVGLAVDHARTIYATEAYESLIYAMPHAFVNATPKWENGLAGNDSLPAVLPGSANLSAQFAPTNDQPWLTITGVTNGVVSYSFTANTGTTNRVATISVLGVPVTVTQNVVAYPTVLMGVELLGSGSLQFSFTNNPNASAAAFTVLTTTNLVLPLAQWTVLGSPTNIAPGLFQFTDTQNTNGGARFYSVRLP